MKDSTAKTLSTFHTFVYRASRGRIGRRLVNNDMLLLTTTGRVTGKEHTVPLLFLRDGESLVVIASWGGRPIHPEWYRNLVANPKAAVQVLSERFDVVARTADTEERARWWPRIVAANHGYAVYEARTDREIPVVFLEPV